jgi:hypothetical protein
VAFIETAWRRYTRHSRNKAQEIEGAIGPLAETFAHARPFLGAILAGQFIHEATTPRPTSRASMGRTAMALTGVMA